jgi:hypothetical protein
MALTFACLMATGQAFAEDLPKSAATDDAFMTGLRRIGVMAGQAVECSADADKAAKIGEAMALANQIAIHFGLEAAFNYAGAVGYGSGHAFDKAGCTQSIDGWKAVQAKYLNK